MYNFKLTEEIARWAFEATCSSQRNWYFSFTNPTAGPWKTIKGLDENGDEGEVYRFELKENRPDIVIVNDELNLIVIIEAKDSLKKLIAGNQVHKSVGVVYELSNKLQRLHENRFWRRHSEYPIIMGLLWGANRATTDDSRNNAFDIYHTESLQYQNLNHNFILGIETQKVNNGLTCKICGKNFEQPATFRLDDIARSFNLPLLT